jgi:UDP-glucose:(glucosyl)LPS alpha-1,2-glucosyltransferase
MTVADKDGTFTSSGAQGGTELMLAGLKRHVAPELLDRVNIICSRVRELHPTKPNILWCHDLWNDPEVSFLRDARSHGKFAKVVFVSHYQQASYAAGLGLPYSKGVVLQNAIEPFANVKKPEIVDGRVNLIYHTTPHRGLELLVPVFIELTQLFPNMHLEVFSSFNAYGWPERDKPYKEAFDLCREHPQITYHGFQPNAVVRQALERAHIFAYPSIWTETSCIAAIEAFAAGCDVVTSTLGALPETSANFGYLYPWSENITDHADAFYNILGSRIEDVIQSKAGDALAQERARRQMQSVYFNTIYNWQYRANQWTNFLTYILAEYHHDQK